ncbi:MULTISPECIES: tripartite tricarboxylate transporter TctB family protein [unclassified Beijerinckia]|uniref:tripartite tricarboxylate transporter TctB family protein n=1 Tax=unclassified Beijerinckia TaxID=2638183 RepID=UPI00089A9943|nr:MULTISPECIES: tripartite tricarboxylate transporter TctB family protein [unclassified Beijerinckia]MDH7797334.1 hypothetical protein [Beijerinckia sp. GAS462]SEC81448.1 Tripartite tricarboxylate transporter TctB family protein [Beijerinckia sp. 28-YEA-48]
MSDIGNTTNVPGGASDKNFNFPQDVGAGIFLVLVSLFFMWQAYPLPLGSLRAMGPGMLPMSIAAMVAAGGVILALNGLSKGAILQEKWAWRGPFFVLGGVVVFGLLIRTAGLAVAGPASMIFASFATNEFRWKEAVVFSVCMTAACILMFKYLLGLPIPIVQFL